LVVTPRTVRGGVASILISSASQYSDCVPAVRRVPDELYVFWAQTLQLSLEQPLNDQAIRKNTAAKNNFLFILAYLWNKDSKLFIAATLKSRKGCIYDILTCTMQQFANLPVIVSGMKILMN
jgi:hypothetical protein